MLFCILSRRTQRTFSSHKHGRIIVSVSRITWRPSIDFCQPFGSIQCGVRIRFLKTPRKLPSRMSRFQTTTSGSTRTKAFSTWSSKVLHHLILWIFLRVFGKRINVSSHRLAQSDIDRAAFYFKYSIFFSEFAAAFSFNVFDLTWDLLDDHYFLDDKYCVYTLVSLVNDDWFGSCTEGNLEPQGL